MATRAVDHLSIAHTGYAHASNDDTTTSAWLYIDWCPGNKSVPEQALALVVKLSSNICCTFDMVVYVCSLPNLPSEHHTDRVTHTQVQVSP